MTSLINYLSYFSSMPYSSVENANFVLFCSVFTFIIKEINN